MTSILSTEHLHYCQLANASEEEDRMPELTLSDWANKTEIAASKAIIDSNRTVKAIHFFFRIAGHW